MLPVEINIKKQKGLDVAIYTPPSQCKNYFTTELTKVLNKYRVNNKNMVNLGDCNMQQTNKILFTFLQSNNFVNIVKSNLYFNSAPESLKDWILTNQPKNPEVMETRISYHLTLIFSFLKISFTKMPPNKLQCRNYKRLEAESF